MRTAIACGVLVLASCSSNGPEISTSQDNVCDQIAQVACFDMYQCCSEGEIESILMVNETRTESDCESDLRTRCQRQVADFDFSIKDKHVTFDSKTMNACLKEFVAPSNACVTVDSVKPWAMACMTSAWVGAVAVGGTCDFPYECVANSFCAPNRVCTALPTENMPCPSDACAKGLFCDTAAVGGPVCLALLAQGNACTSTAQCQDGLFCDLGTPSTAPTCKPLLADGTTCSGSLTCASKLCLTGTCSMTGFTCTSDASCEGRCSNSSALCTADNQCGEGACSIGGTPCLSPADCTGTGNTCVFTNKCNLDTCTGNVCAEPHLTIDYCQTALEDLPLLGAGQVAIGGGSSE